jgi:quercetin dioxygenase-like cupin family protein
MKRKKLILSCLFAAGLFALPEVFAQPENQLVRSSAIFEGKTRVRSVARNELHETNVRIQNVAIVGGQKLDSIGLRSDGIVIIQLRGGKLTTIIDGKRQQRKEGEFWTVPAGARMTFETEDDTATIQTIEISRS